MEVLHLGIRLAVDDISSASGWLLWDICVRRSIGIRWDCEVDLRDFWLCVADPWACFVVVRMSLAAVLATDLAAEETFDEICDVTHRYL